MIVHFTYDNGVLHEMLKPANKHKHRKNGRPGETHGLEKCVIIALCIGDYLAMREKAIKCRKPLEPRGRWCTCSDAIRAAAFVRALKARQRERHANGTGKFVS